MLLNSKNEQQNHFGIGQIPNLSFFMVLEIELRAFHMPGKRPATEQQLRPAN
jgi:hypothetical protein